MRPEQLKYGTVATDKRQEGQVETKGRRPVRGTARKQALERALKTF